VDEQSSRGGEGGRVKVKSRQNPALDWPNSTRESDVQEIPNDGGDERCRMTLTNLRGEKKGDRKHPPKEEGERVTAYNGGGEQESQSGLYGTSLTTSSMSCTLGRTAIKWTEGKKRVLVLDKGWRKRHRRCERMVTG